MRFKRVSLTPSKYDSMIREGISISDALKSAFRRGVMAPRLNLVLFLSETGGLRGLRQAGQPHDAERVVREHRVLHPDEPNEA